MGVDDDDYDDDFYDDDYNDAPEQELSDEDKEQMRVNTPRVRDALGSAYNVSDKDIQDALWHYYYDVGKSATYLKSKDFQFLPDISHLRIQTHTSQHLRCHRKALPQRKVCKVSPYSYSLLHLPPTKHAKTFESGSDGDQDLSSRISMNKFFQDCPWLNIPLHRQALIVEHPCFPRPRLLGGGPKDGKTSKLAALAARRRQKEATKSSLTDPDQPVSVDDYAETLNKLRISQSRGSAKAGLEAAEESPQVEHNVQPPSQVNAQETESHEAEEPTNSNQDLRANPSSFATLITTTKHTDTTKSLSFPGPASGAGTFDFSGPSPDDVFTKAQSKRPGIK